MILDLDLPPPVAIRWVCATRHNGDESGKLVFHADNRRSGALANLPDASTAGGATSHALTLQQQKHGSRDI